MIYITGDTHGDVDYKKLLSLKEKNGFTNIVKYVYGFRFYKQEDWNKAFKEINL